jgi:hypothetical protein
MFASVKRRIEPEALNLNAMLRKERGQGPIVDLAWQVRKNDPGDHPTVFSNSCILG